jgi:hypothetical protein
MENKKQSSVIPNTNYSICIDGTLINNKTGKVKKFTKDTNGYMKTQIWTNGEKKNITQHRILAEAFIPNPMSKKEINHKNGNKQDNRIENLEWCSRSENMTHCYRELGKAAFKPTKFVMNPSTGVVYSSVTEAASVLGISRSYLSNMLRGFQNNHTNLILL